jgi:peptidyl-arginine deiminase
MLRRVLVGIGAGLVVGVLIVQLAGLARGEAHTRTRLVAEDASAPLRRIAIHYAPASDPRALGIWQQLFAVLPAAVDVDVEVAQASDYDRLLRKLRAAGTPHLGRFHRVVVGAPITTWSRDRYAALVDDGGAGSILAPPRIETPFYQRAGDMQSPAAISRALYGRDPRISEIVFEGGDLAATPRWVFADTNLANRNLGRAAADRPSIERELRRHLGQELVWLGDALGDVPRHHIMMYMMPLDDGAVAVGDVRAGLRLLDDPTLALDDVEVEARRFDRAAELLAARGFRVLRVPVVVLEGAGSYVTYTNALFDRRGATRIIYMPTYNLPALDEAGAAFWRGQGFEVHPIDVSPIYQLNGSLGCLVNVTARG